MEITYRRPVPGEAEAFAALHVQCWREAYGGFLPEGLLASFSTAKRLPLWQAVTTGSNRFAMGAYDGARPCGFVISGGTDEAFVPDQDGHLHALYIAASHHRRGIGRRLLALAAQDWLGQGGRSFTVGVLAANSPARAFYERMGAVLVRQSVYRWDGHDLEDCIYHWPDLAKIAKG